MDRKKFKKNIIDIGKDILLAFTVVAIIMLALFAYCGIWPPMVVVESGSMQRYDERSIVGAIDTGDMVFVKTVDNSADLVTYVDGEMTGHTRYGNFGDVIIYRPNGDAEKVPIIHRAVVWLEVNDTLVSPTHVGIDHANYTFDVPSLGLYGTTEDIVLSNYGFWDDEVTISLQNLLNYYNFTDKVPHGGFITMGDHNAPTYDQPGYEPVLPDWIVGKAIGEIPWFGLIKLKVTGTAPADAPRNSWNNLFITVFILLLVPFLFDYYAPKIMQKRKTKKEEQARAKKLENSDEKSGEAPPDDGQPKISDKKTE